MKEVSIIGVDLAKNVFQLHGAAADGTVVFRKKLSRLSDISAYGTSELISERRVSGSS